MANAKEILGSRAMTNLLQEAQDEAALLLQSDEHSEGCLLLQNDAPTEQSKEACLLLQGAQHSVMSLEVGSDAEASLSVESDSALDAVMMSGTSAASIERVASKLKKVVESAANGESVEPVTQEALQGIIETMSDILNATLVQDAADRVKMQKSQDRIEDCGKNANTSHTEAGGIHAMASDVTAARLDHSSCRTTEVSENRTMITDCTDFTNFKGTLQESANKCACKWNPIFGEVNNSEASIWLKEVPEKSVLQCMINTNSWSTHTLKVLKNKTQLCHGDKRRYKEQREHCGDKQARFESHFCEYSQRLKETCKTQETCRAQEIIAHQAECARIAQAVQARKGQTFAANKVNCYIKMLLEKTFQNYTRCESLTVTVDHLDIDCLPVPPAFDCNTKPVLHEPCGEQWIQAEYSGTAWVKEAIHHTCTPCYSGATDTEIRGM